MGLPSELAELTGGRRRGAFTRAEALSAGFSERQIRTMLTHNDWVRLREGIYAEREVVESARTNDVQSNVLLAEAAALGIDNAVISHGSAVGWWRLAHLQRTIGTRAEVTCPSPGSRKRWMDDLTVVRCAALPPSHLRTLDGVSVTSAGRTVADVARHIGFLDGVVVGDSALAKRLIGRGKIEDVLADVGRWPGVRQAREVTACLDARAQNPLESLCHARWWEAGLPRPELQAWVFDEDGFVGIVDGIWLDPVVAYETDGMVKYDRELDGPGTMRFEKLRQERLENALVVLRRFTWDELWFEPKRCVRRMNEAAAEAKRRTQPPRVRIYVGDKDAPAPEPDLRVPPEAHGLTLAYDGIRRML